MTGTPQLCASDPTWRKTMDRLTAERTLQQQVDTLTTEVQALREELVPGLAAFALAFRALADELRAKR